MTTSATGSDDPLIVTYQLLVVRSLVERELDDLAFRLRCHFLIGMAKQLRYLLRHLCDALFPGERELRWPGRDLPGFLEAARGRAVECLLEESEGWSVLVHEGDTYSFAIAENVVVTVSAGSGFDPEGDVRPAMVMRFAFCEDSAALAFTHMMRPGPSNVLLDGPERIQSVDVVHA